MASIQITSDLSIPENEIDMTFIRSAGPGGQNVNKVASAVQLRFNVAKSPSLPTDVRKRLKQLAGKRLTDDGVLVIIARRHRTQEQNRQDAIERLADLIRSATKAPKRRRKTKPTLASRERRLKKKRRRSEIKRLRGRPDQE